MLIPRADDGARSPMMKQPSILEGMSMKYAPKPSLTKPELVRQTPQPPTQPFCARKEDRGTLHAVTFESRIPGNIMNHIRIQNPILAHVK